MKQNIPQTPPPVPKNLKHKPGCWKIGLIIFVAFIAVSFVISLFSADEQNENTNPKMAREEFLKQTLDKQRDDSTFIENATTLVYNAGDLEAAAKHIIRLNDIISMKITDSTFMDVYNEPVIKEYLHNNSTKASKIFPEVKTAARDKYIEKLKNALWEENIDVVTSRDGKTITFIGGLFANRKNIKEWQNNIGQNLKILGFKRVEYKWIKHDPEYTYYDL